MHPTKSSESLTYKKFLAKPMNLTIQLEKILHGLVPGNGKLETLLKMETKKI